MKAFHHNDLDGRAAGAILWKVMHERHFDETSPAKSPMEAKDDFIEMDYSKPFPVDIIEPNERVFILDFHVQDDDEFRALQEITNNIVLIDHHKSTLEHAKEHPELYENIKTVLDESHSGCWLAWKYLNWEYSLSPHEHPPIPYALMLIDDMDRWVWDYDDTLGFITGMKLYLHQPWDDIWDTLLIQSTESLNLIRHMKNEGELCAKYDEMISNDYCNSYGWETEFEGHKAFAQGMYRGGSKAFGERMNQYPLCLSYEFTGDKWIVGLYSETIDVSEIAVKYGGGGHKGASGFTCEQLPFHKNLREH